MATDLERRQQVDLGSLHAALTWCQQELVREKTRSTALEMRLAEAVAERDQATRLAATLVHERSAAAVEAAAAEAVPGEAV